METETKGAAELKEIGQGTTTHEFIESRETAQGEGETARDVARGRAKKGITTYGLIEPAETEQGTTAEGTTAEGTA